MAKHIKTMSGPYASGFKKLELKMIKASQTIYKGSFVRLGTGGVEAINSANDDIGFIVRGFVQPLKTGFQPLENVESSNYLGTLTQTAGSENYAAHATNQTADKVMAVCEPVLPGVEYRVQLDATRGSTVGSDTIGYHLSTTTGRQAAETSSTATAEQLIIMDVPQDEADVVDVYVRELQFAGVHA